MKDSDRYSLIAYRLEQANRTLRQAEILHDANEWDGAINRGYYAMFYAALALLLTKALGSSKHAGVLSLVDREFVKPGLFPKEMSRTLRSAFNARQKFDYTELSPATTEAAVEILEQARAFVSAVATYVSA